MTLIARLADLAQREAPRGALVAERADGAVLLALAEDWSLEFWPVWRHGGVLWRGEERRAGRVTRMEEGLCEWDCLEWAARRLRATPGDFGRRAAGVFGKCPATGRNRRVAGDRHGGGVMVWPAV